MAYKWLSETRLQRLEDLVSFPADPACREYQQFLQWEEAGNQAIPLEPEPLEQIQQRQIEVINAAAQSAVALYMSAYPDFEQLSWATQERESEAWIAAAPEDRTEALVPWCTIAAAARKDRNGDGMPLAEFMGRVAEKVAAFKAISAEVAGARQGLEDRIMAARTALEIEAIVWGAA